MAQMLVMTAFQSSAPMALIIQIEIDDLAIHLDGRNRELYISAVSNYTIAEQLAFQKWLKRSIQNP